MAASQADAIDFTSGTNSLTLGGAIEGGIGISGSLTLATTRNFTLASQIHDASGGAGSLTYDGGNTLTLTGANTYSGGTTIEAGMLVLKDATGGTIDGAGTGAIAIDGGATLELAASGTLSNEVNFDSGTATIAAATGVTVDFTGLFGNTGASTIVFGSASAQGTVVYGSDSGEVVNSGASTIEVAGGTLRDGGGLDLLISQSPVSPGATTQIDAGATLDLAGNDDQLAGLAGAGTVTNSAGAQTGIVSGTFAGTIAGAADVYFAPGMAGPSTTTLTGVSTYTGATTIDDGATLVLGAQASINTTSGITLDGTLQLGGDTVATGAITAASGSTLTGTGTVATALNDAGAVVAASGKALYFTKNDTFSGAISGSGAIRFASGNDTLAKGASLSVRQTQITGATVTLGTNISDTGGLSLASGTLALGGYGFVVAGTSTLSGGTVLGAGTLQMRGTSTLSGLSLSNATLSNYGTIAQTGKLSLAGAAGATDAEVNQKGATWTLSDNAALTLTGTAADTFSNVGTLQKTTGTGKAVVGVGVANTGTISATSGTLDLAGVVNGTGTETIGAAGILELGKAIAATQALTFSGVGGQLLLDDAHDFHAGVTGFAHGDTMDLSTFGTSGEKFTYTPSGSGTTSGGTLAITSGTNTASIALHGTYTANQFHLASDGHGGTNVTYG